ATRRDTSPAPYPPSRPGELLLIVTDGLFELPGATIDTLTQLATNLRTAPDLQLALTAFMEAAGPDLDDDTTLTAIRRNI
ncbi:SpoIIE family protein phosphatase, partial [Curtobacterium sp. VKM Ac-2887]|uniref:SpoIIE family protein phosphatase n=1 Tax=Curtobacterium sp. VKM Ac-2887 TaxID=2783819 RepID=UPI00188B0578